MSLVNEYQSDSDDDALPEPPSIIDFTFNKSPKQLRSNPDVITTYVYIDWKLDPSDSQEIANAIKDANELLNCQFRSFSQEKLVKESQDHLHVSLSYNLKFSTMESLDKFINYLQNHLPQENLRSRFPLDLILNPFGKPFVLPNPDSTKLFLALPFDGSSEDILAPLIETINDFIGLYTYELSPQADKKKKENCLYDPSMIHLSIGVSDLDEKASLPQYLNYLNEKLGWSQVYADVTPQTPTSALVCKMRTVVELSLEGRAPTNAL